MYTLYKKGILYSVKSKVQLSISGTISKAITLMLAQNPYEKVLSHSIVFAL